MKYYGDPEHTFATLFILMLALVGFVIWNHFCPDTVIGFDL